MLVTLKPKKNVFTLHAWPVDNKVVWSYDGTRFQLFKAGMNELSIHSSFK